MPTVDLTYSRSYPVGVADAFDRLLPVDLPEIFGRRYLALPPITAVTDQDGPWGTPGQTRTVLTADRSRLRETLTSVDRPTSFGYSLVPVGGPLGALVASIEGRWSFDPAGTGVRITWAWSILARNRYVVPLLPLVGAQWRGFARQGFDEIERVLLAG